MKRKNISKLNLNLAHNKVRRYQLIKVGESKTKLQTMNDAFLLPGESFPPHKHPDCEEVYYFLEGEGVMTINKESFGVKKGDCVLVEINEYHSLKNNTKNKNLRFITIRILI